MKRAQKELEKKEKERHEMMKKELGYQNYKEWLKKSMLKQREEQIQQRLEKERARQEQDREKKAKANLKVMSKIAFKEWKEKKAKQLAIDKRQKRLEKEQERLIKMRRGNNSQERGKEVILAYGLNKNLKKVSNRAKSAKPRKQRNQNAFDEM